MEKDYLKTMEVWVNMQVAKFEIRITAEFMIITDSGKMKGVIDGIIVARFIDMKQLDFQIFY